VIPVVQRIHASGGVEGKLPGDCVKCCVASILELDYEGVPHFVARQVLIPQLGAQPYAADWYTGLNYWLRTSGWALRAEHRRYFKSPLPLEYSSEFDLYDPLERPRVTSPHMGYWIATVVSENFARSTHAVVMLDGDVVHDPSMHPRRTPYQFVGEMHFIATDPARCRAALLDRPGSPAVAAPLDREAEHEAKAVIHGPR
jgi:hypothetical protein